MKYIDIVKEIEYQTNDAIKQLNQFEIRTLSVDSNYIAGILSSHISTFGRGIDIADKNLDTEMRIYQIALNQKQNPLFVICWWRSIVLPIFTNNQNTILKRLEKYDISIESLNIFLKLLSKEDGRINLSEKLCEQIKKSPITAANYTKIHKSDIYRIFSNQSQQLLNKFNKIDISNFEEIINKLDQKQITNFDKLAKLHHEGPLHPLIVRFDCNVYKTLRINYLYKNKIIIIHIKITKLNLKLLLENTDKFLLFASINNFSKWSDKFGFEAGFGIKKSNHYVDNSKDFKTLLNNIEKIFLCKN